MEGPTIVSSRLRESIDRALATIHEGKKGRAGATVTLDGLTFEVGYRPATWLDIAGYAGREWGGPWEAGARVGSSW